MRRRMGLLFAITILLGAFLLFAVQPLIARFILPWFGGAASVWTTCLLFFQALLLGGYAYAHLLADRMTPRRQALVHVVLLLACLATLPIAPSPRWAPQDASYPTFRVLLLLAVTVGLPYFALAATSPLVQHWFAGLFPRRSVYRLYALSNAGSLAALISYPFVIEPMLSRRTQSWGWSGLFAAFAIACAVSAIEAAQHARQPPSPQSNNPGTDDAGPLLTARTSLLILALTALASLLLMSATNKLCQEIAPFPFLWVVPLTVYLVAFILCFEYPRFYRRLFIMPLTALATLFSAYAMMRRGGVKLPAHFAAHCSALLLCCIFCLGETARLRPAARQLTRYYLLVALGGVIGGAVVTLLAPLIFSQFIELHFSYLSAWVLGMAILLLDRASALRGFRRPWVRFVMIVIFPLLGGMLYSDAALTTLRRIYADRSFYGVLEVIENAEPDPRRRNRELIHNGITHGVQFTHEDFRRKPVCYYEPFSGVGLALTRFRNDQPRRIAVVGLGAGTLAAYGKAEDQVTFFELDPGVIAVARSHFTYLADTPAKVRIITGDARLSLTREANEQKYDVIVLDAFSGDAVPVHLLTVEAFELYRRRLKEGGLIAAHLSNLHLNLLPPVWAAARKMNFSAAVFATVSRQTPYPSEWLLITADTGFLDSLRSDPAYRDWRVRQVQPWTDDRAPLFLSLRMLGN